MPSLLTPLLSLLFLSNPFATAFRLRCTHPHPFIFETAPPVLPKAADCRLILAHIPSAPPPQSYNTPLLFSPSLPFLPPAFLRHGTCAIIPKYTPPSLHFYDPATVLRYTAPPVMELYRAIKDAGEQIVQQCVEAGTGWGGLATGRERGVGWEVFVIHRSSTFDRLWDYREEGLKEMMAGSREPIWRMGNGHWPSALWEFSLWEV